MQEIPFFPKFVIYFPMVVGVFMFLFSFSNKMYLAWKESFGEKTADKFRLFFRYGSPFVILTGIIQFILR